MRHIILAFFSDKPADKIRNMLEGTEYRTGSSICRSGAELLRAVNDYDDVLIIMGFKLPDMTVNDVYENVHSGCRIVSIMKAEHTEDILYEEILALPLPVSRMRLLSALNVLFGTIPAHKEGKTRSEEENKLIDQAKLLLMERYHMTEQQAHRFIQKRSMDTGAKLTDTAKAVLNIDEN